MSTETAWPPHSATAALLASPSGRKKFAENPGLALHGSPAKRSTTTPSLLERMRAAKNNQDILDEPGEDDEEDEETLRLKLAAIEAKLKLRKLQKDKARREVENVRPANDEERKVEVLLSPVKRRQIPTEQKSPRRVLLGIDKGIRGADVSLRRAKSSAGTPFKDRLNSTRTGNRSPTRTSERPSASQRHVEASNVKSFSERMAKGREADKHLESRRQATRQSRNSGFKVDHTELDMYKKAAEDASKPVLKSPRRIEYEVMYKGNELNELEQREREYELAKVFKEAGAMPDVKKKVPESIAEAKSHQGDASLYEGYSQLHLTTRILPHSFLKRTLPSETHTIYRLPDLLREVTSPDYQIRDDVGDYVVFAVIASRSSPLDHKQPQGDEQTHSNTDWERKWDDGSQNQRKFIALTLTDLKWTIDLYLFGTAVPRYHRLTPGTVVAILNPGIMPPKKGKEDTGAFSLTLNDGDDTVLEIGTARDLGFCNVIKKDGKECGSWVDSSKTEICEWHLNVQIAKAQAGRMGVNTGTNGFKGGFKGGAAVQNRHNIFDSRLRGEEGRIGLKPLKHGQQYDRYSQTSYYVSSSNVSKGIINPPTRETAVRPLGFEENPFLPDGQFSRDKKAHLQKRKKDQAKEQEVARQLTEMNERSAGAEYMRQAVNSKKTDMNGQSAGSQERQRAALATKMDILGGLGRNENGKREADSVSLSPVKKARFLAKRRDLGVGREEIVGSKQGDVSDEDDLDILQVV